MSDVVLRGGASFLGSVGSPRRAYWAHHGPARLPSGPGEKQANLRPPFFGIRSTTKPPDVGTRALPSGWLVVLLGSSTDISRCEAAKISIRHNSARLRLRAHHRSPGGNVDRCFRQGRTPQILDVVGHRFRSRRWRTMSDLGDGTANCKEEPSESLASTLLRCLYIPVLIPRGIQRICTYPMTTPGGEINPVSLNVHGQQLRQSTH